MDKKNWHPQFEHQYFIKIKGGISYLFSNIINKKFNII